MAKKRITNESEYQIAKDQLARLEAKLSKFSKPSQGSEIIMAELRDAISEWEARK